MNYAANQRNPGKHFSGLAVVVLFHVVLVYALVTGLAKKVVDVVKGPLEAKLIEQIKPPPPEEAPPPPPKLVPPPPFIPPPEITIAAQQSTGPTITAVTQAPPPPAAAPQPTVAAAPAPPAPAAVRVPPVIDAARSCKQPEYPAASKRLEETGTTVLRFLIDVSGKVVESKVQTSSGSPRLDEAARAALSQCQFKPGTVDNKPEPSWASLRYTWQLQ
jgi:periplasmic protein TonB